MGVGLGTRVAAPPVLAGRYGLLASAFDPTDSDVDDVWQKGVEYAPAGVDQAGTIAQCRTPGDAITDDGTAAASPVILAEPYTLVAGEECKPLEAIEAVQARAAAKLENTTARAAEVVFSTNPDGVTTPYLEDDGTRTLIDAATPTTANAPKLAAQLIANWIADTSGQLAMIHVTPAIAVAWEALGLLSENDSRRLVLRATGHVVVVGDGYRGFSAEAVPAAAADATHKWVFVTGPIVKRVTPVRPMVDVLGDLLDRDTNLVTARAVRELLLYWDTAVHGALLVDPFA